MTPPARYAPTGSTGTTRTQRIPFPRLATSGADTRTAPTTRLGSTPGRSSAFSSGSPYVRSRSGPSISRLSSDRTREAPSTGPSSRVRTTGASETSRVPSSRTIDRQSILERYGNRFPRSSGGDRTVSEQGPSTSRTRTTSGADRTRRTGPDTSSTGSRTAGRDRTTRSGLASERTRDTGRDAGLRAADNTRRLRDVASVNPRRADDLVGIGRQASDATRVALNVGIGISLGYGYGYGYGYGCYGYPYYGGWGYYGGGYSYYWACGGYSYSPYCHPYSWPYYWWYGSFPYGISSWYPSYGSSYYSAPVYYASAISTYVSEPAYVEPVQEVVYVEEESVGEAVAQSTGTEQMPAPATENAALDPNARASGQYLTLGDQAFRDGRFADAVHFYARAVEYAPNEGILYLVLADGLFATGDYHYGAYALRKALELDPSLSDSNVDKHTFYTDPIEFDRQLATLEEFVLDHRSDSDARLMLAANYLFGGRPAAAVDLLEDPSSVSVISQDAGALLLAAARSIQHGR